MFAKMLHDLHCIEACGDRVALIEFWLLPWLESMQLQHYAAEGKSWCLKLRLITVYVTLHAFLPGLSYCIVTSCFYSEVGCITPFFPNFMSFRP